MPGTDTLTMYTAMRDILTVAIQSFADKATERFFLTGQTSIEWGFMRPDPSHPLHLPPRFALSPEGERTE